MQALSTFGLRALACAILAVVCAAPVSARPAGGEIVLTGRMTLDHADGFDDGRSADYPVLETATDRVSLIGLDVDRVVPGATVAVRGHRSGSRFVVSAGKHSLSVVHAAATPGTTGEPPSTALRVAVLLINFIDHSVVPALPSPPPEPWTEQQVRDVYFDGARSVAAYLSELSDGQMSVTGDVFGYFTLNTSTRTCEYTNWGAEARRAAAGQGIDLATYTHIVHAFTHRQACWWRGIAALPGNKNWINGAMNPYVATHELGHNFGLHHASTTNCTRESARVPFSTSCTQDEYGDPYSVMGYTGPRQMHGWHRVQMGLLAPDEVESVSSSGTYRLAPIANGPASDARVLRVARPQGDHWYLEYRQPHGTFDDFTALDNAVNGLMIRLAPDGAAIARSKLVDATPDTSSFLDAPLALGQTFSDPVGGISITLLSLHATRAEVQIRFGPPPAPADPPAPTDVTAPTTPGSLTATLTLPDQARLSWAAATDDLAVDHYVVRLDGVAYARTRDLTLDAVRLADGYTYSVGVSAVDAAGNTSAEATTQLVAPDVTPPRRMPSLSATRVDATEVRLAWPAVKDNIGVSGFLIFRDASPFATAAADATSFLDDSVVAERRYSYAVGALDAAGNLGVTALATISAAITDRTPPTAPTGLSATSLGSRRVFLEWSASTDDTGGAVKYHVFRGRKRIATVSTTSYTDRTSRARAYRYRVRAVDGAGNRSPFSETVIGVARR